MKLLIGTTATAAVITIIFAMAYMSSLIRDISLLQEEVKTEMDEFKVSPKYLIVLSVVVKIINLAREDTNSKVR